MTCTPKVFGRFLLVAMSPCVFALTMTCSATAAETIVDKHGPPVDLFVAMDAGQIDVKFIPQNATKANLLVRNLTDQPLNVRLPHAFAGVPVLGQGMGMGGMGGGMGGMGGGMGGMGGGMGGGGGGQAMGGGGGMGGMGGMGGGMGGMGGGMGGGGGFMRVPPERMQKVMLNTVCLEHGKPDPNPKMAYAIVPLDRVTKDPRVHLLCQALGNGQIAQNTAQAAAWHMMDNLSWDELAAKNRVESKYIGTIRWFSPLELRTAMTVVNEITSNVSAKASSSPETEAVQESKEREAKLNRS